MNKAQKRLMSSAIAAASVFSVVAPAVHAETVDVDTLVANALQTKNFSEWNTAYGEVMKLEKTNPTKYLELLGKLASVSKEVVTPEISELNKLVDKIAYELSGRAYSEFEAKVNASTTLSAMDKGYYLGELAKWGKKLVWTEEYTAAMDVVGKLWTNIDKAGVDAANAAIAKLTGDNVKYVQELLDEVITKKNFNNIVVDSVTVVSNNRVEVALKEAALKAPAASDFVIKDSTGTALAVSAVKLSADGKTVILTTASQTGSALYTLTVKGTDYKFVGLAADTTKPTLTGAVATKNTKVELTFGEKVDDNALNVANYSIAGLNVLKAEYAKDDDGNLVKTQVNLTTSAQDQGTVYKVVVTNVTDMSGNVINADNDEWEFGGIPADTGKPTLESAIATTNKIVEVTFSEELDKASAENIANYKIEGLSVVKAELKSDNVTVKLTTAAQDQGTVYKVVVTNVKDEAGNVIDSDYDEYEFGGVPADTDKPTLDSAVAATNTTVTLTFSEDMDKASVENIANYKIEGLTVTKAEIDEDDASLVKLTTSKQDQGTVYKVVVTNVKDLSGNVVNSDNDEFEFGGVPADTDKPTVLSAIATDNTHVKVTFSEPMDSTTAKQAYNYYLGTDLGYATSVAKSTVDGETDGDIWILTTKAQDTKAYTLDVTGVKDLSGNVVDEDNDTADFGGLPASSDTTAPKMSSAIAVNKNTIKVTFNEAMDADTITTGSFAVTVKSGTDTAATKITSTTASGIQVSDDKKTVTLQWATATMTAGVVYTVAATGVEDKAGNTINADYDTASFSGSKADNPAPKVSSVTALNNQTLKVTFSEPITVDVDTLDGTEFTFGGSTTFDGSFVRASLSSNKKELTVYYSGSEATNKFQSGKIYSVKLATAKFTDELDVATLAENADDAGNTAEVKFGGSSANVVAPKISSVVAVDKNTIDITFNQKVDISALVEGDVTIDGVAVSAALVRAEGDDGNKIRVFFNETPALSGGQVYTVDLNEAHIKNLNGTVMAAADNYKKFAAVSTANKAPKLVSAYAKDANTIVVTFSEKVSSVDADNFSTAAGLGTLAVVADDGDDNAATYSITTENAFGAGTIYELSVVAGSSAIKDEAGVGSADTSVKVKFVGR